MKINKKDICYFCNRNIHSDFLRNTMYGDNPQCFDCWASYHIDQNYNMMFLPRSLPEEIDHIIFITTWRFYPIICP